MPHLGCDGRTRCAVAWGNPSEGGSRPGRLLLPFPVPADPGPGARLRAAGVLRASAPGLLRTAAPGLLPAAGGLPAVCRVCRAASGLLRHSRVRGPRLLRRPLLVPASSPPLAPPARLVGPRRAVADKARSLECYGRSELALEVDTSIRPIMADEVSTSQGKFNNRQLGVT